MKSLPIALLLTSLLPTSMALAGDPKPLVNQAGNGFLDLSGTALILRNDIQLALDGPGLPIGYMAVRVKITARQGEPLRISPDDFTLLSRKDGQRSSALTPHQIAGGGTVLVVKPAAEQPRGDGTTVNGPVWGGVSVARKRSSTTTTDDASVKTGTAEEDSPLLKVLTEKALPDKEIDKDKRPTIEGLLYFAADAKLKAKDLSLIYQGAAGKLVIDFK
jgi:uncharacterized protein (DUF1684 family)